MRRARKRHVAAAALAAVLAAAAPAAAFHAGPTFDLPAAAGGGESIYYGGSPLEHGWQCDFCHQSPAGLISLRVSQPELFATDNVYTPGQKYVFTVDMEGAHLGQEWPENQYNGLLVQVMDENGNPIQSGGLNFPQDFVSTFQGNGTIVTDGLTPGLTHWTFTWFAPSANGGPDGGLPGSVTFYFAAVNGNAADGGAARQDPFGDDFVQMAVPIRQGKAMTGAADPPPAPAGPAGVGEEPWSPGVPVLPGALACMVGLVMVGATRRGRARRA
jgi:hypothetical protein